MARPWSARCSGVARQREGSRQNSIGGSGVLSLRHFGLVLFIPWRVGAEQAGAAKDAIMAYGFGGAVADFVRNSWLRGPRLSYLLPLRGREGAAGQAVVCPLLRGSSPTRGVAPKRHRGAPACFLSGISGWFSLSLNPLARGCRRSWRGEIWFRRRDAARPARAAWI